MDAADEEKFNEAFVRVASRVIKNREIWVKQTAENAEKVYLVKASVVDAAAIDTRLGDLRKEMSALVKLNLTTGVDTEFYGTEYNRINGEMKELHGKRWEVTQTEIVRWETLEKVREIDKVLTVSWNLMRVYSGCRLSGLG